MPDLRACWLVRAWPVTRRGRACRKPTSRGSLTQPPAAGGGGGGVGVWKTVWKVITCQVTHRVGRKKNVLVIM